MRLSRKHKQGDVDSEGYSARTRGSAWVSSASKPGSGISGKSCVTVRDGDYQSYKAGALSYLNVIMAQSTALMTEAKSIQITLELSWLRSLFRSLFLYH